MVEFTCTSTVSFLLFVGIDGRMEEDVRTEKERKGRGEGRSVTSENEMGSRDESFTSDETVLTGFKCRSTENETVSVRLIPDREGRHPPPTLDFSP